MFSGPKPMREILADIRTYLFTDQSCIDTSSSLLRSQKNLAPPVSGHLLYSNLIEEVWLIKNEGSYYFSDHTVESWGNGAINAPKELMNLLAETVSSVRDHCLFCTESKEQRSDVLLAQHAGSDFRSLLSPPTYLICRPVKTSPRSWRFTSVSQPACSSTCKLKTLLSTLRGFWSLNLGGHRWQRAPFLPP